MLLRLTGIDESFLCEKLIFAKEKLEGVACPSGLHTRFTGLPLKRSAVQYPTIYILYLTSQQRLNFVPITE